MIHLTADELPRVMQCNGSRLLPRVVPPSDDPGSTRQEGIAAHHMALSVFNGTVSDPYDLVDRRAPNGVYMTPEMAEHVSEYLDVGKASHETTAVLMEHETYLTDHRTFEVKGRTDRIITGPDWLIVDDFKYGWRLVEPDDNWTLIFHAVAFCVSQHVSPARVGFRICQPRPFHPGGTYRIVWIDYTTLLQLYRTLCDRLANLSDTLRTGPNCTTCHAFPCRAAIAAGYNSVDVSTRKFEDTIPDDALGNMLDDISRAKTMITDLEKALSELMRHRIKSGSTFENHALEPVIGNRKWNDGIDAKTFGAYGDVNLTKPGLITPAQAVKAGVPDEVVNMMTHRPTTGFKLVRENANKRATRLLGGK